MELKINAHRRTNDLTIECINLDGRNRAIVIAESLARVIAAIRIASVRWRSYLLLKTQKLVLADPAFVLPAIGVRSFNIRSTWKCGMACES